MIVPPSLWTISVPKGKIFVLFFLAGLYNYWHPKEFPTKKSRVPGEFLKLEF